MKPVRPRVANVTCLNKGEKIKLTERNNNSVLGKRSQRPHQLNARENARRLSDSVSRRVVPTSESLALIFLLRKQSVTSKKKK